MSVKDQISKKNKEISGYIDEIRVMGFFQISYVQIQI